METDLNNAEDSDDVEDQLPDLSELTPLLTHKPKTAVIKVGEVVWALFRKVYWPALVRKVYSKRRMASVWYLDSPYRCFKVPFSKMHSFVDKDFAQKVRAEVMSSPVKQLHDEVCSSSYIYARRQASGIKDDPGAYFDPSIPYLCLQKLKSEGKLTFGEDLNICSSIVLKDQEYAVDSDNESEVVSEEDEMEIFAGHCRLDDDEGDMIDEDKLDLIIDCVKQGRVDKYLLDVRACKTPSEYHNIFTEAMKSGNFRLLHTITAGIIVRDVSKLREISLHVLNLYEKCVKNGKCGMMKYVMNVWFPEAIKKATALVEAKEENATSLKNKAASAKRKLFSSNSKESKSYTCKVMPQNKLKIVKKDLVKNSRKKIPLRRSSRKCAKSPQEK